MKRKWRELSRRYEAALHKHVERRSHHCLSLARKVGGQAAALGLNALDLARIHDLALASLGASNVKDGLLTHADLFFAEAFVPLERLSPAACEAAAQLEQSKRDLQQQTIDLEKSQRTREQGTIELNVLKAALRQKDEHYATLLSESRDLQRCLQSLTRGILSAQEDERVTISRKLRDQVAQAMLAVQVRLAQLENDAARNTAGLKEEIATTQSLVVESAKTLERFADSLG